MRLAQGRQAPSAICISSLCPRKILVIWCDMSHPWLFSHMPFSMSTSSSSSTFPCTTQEHAAHVVHQEQLQEHLVHEQRYQIPFCYENLQSGGNPRTTTPTPRGSVLPKNGRLSFLEKKKSALFFWKIVDWQNLVF